MAVWAGGASRGMWIWKQACELRSPWLAACPATLQTAATLAALGRGAGSRVGAASTAGAPPSMRCWWVASCPTWGAPPCCAPSACARRCWRSSRRCTSPAQVGSAARVRVRQRAQRTCPGLAWMLPALSLEPTPQASCRPASHDLPVSLASPAGSAAGARVRGDGCAAERAPGAGVWPAPVCLPGLRHLLHGERTRSGGGGGAGMAQQPRPCPRRRSCYAATPDAVHARRCGCTARCCPFARSRGSWLRCGSVQGALNTEAPMWVAASSSHSLCTALPTPSPSSLMLC